MKPFLFACCMAIAVLSCNDQSKPATAENPMPDSSAAKPVVTYDYPFKLERPYADWQPGDQQHAVNVMKCLKAYTDGDVANSLSYFGDSVTLHFDYMSEKMSNDSLKHFFTNMRNNYSNITLHMNDWESVISKDKKQEFVTLWYKEVFTDKKGKTDSVSIVDDLQIKNGKIVMLDEKAQHYPVKK